MKLKNLLKIIPEKCKVGFIAADKKCKIGFTTVDDELLFLPYVTKEEAITTFAQRTTTTTDFVKDLEVTAIYPCASTYCDHETVFNDGVPSLHVKMQLLIEVNLGEAE